MHAYANTKTHKRRYSWQKKNPIEHFGHARSSVEYACWVEDEEERKPKSMAEAKGANLILNLNLLKTK